MDPWEICPSRIITLQSTGGAAAWNILVKSLFRAEASGKPAGFAESVSVIAKVDKIALR